MDDQNNTEPEGYAEGGFADKDVMKDMLTCEIDIAPLPFGRGISAEALSRIIAQLSGALTQIVAHNTEALDRLAVSTSAQNARMEALEKQIRYNTPMTQQQAKCLNAAIRARAIKLLDDNEPVAVRKLGNAIRRAVLTRYGAGLFTEIPKDQYPVALTQVQTWYDALAVRDAVKAAQERSGKA